MGPGRLSNMARIGLVTCKPRANLVFWNVIRVFVAAHRLQQPCKATRRNCAQIND